MFNSIRTLLQVDRLAACVEELEAENKSLRKELAYKLLNRPAFREVAKPFDLPEDVGDILVNETIAAFKPYVKKDLIRFLERYASDLAPDFKGFIADDYHNRMFEVELELTPATARLRAAY